MTYYLFEDSVRNEEYTADTVLGVLERIADSCRVDGTRGGFAGDLALFDDNGWQDLLDLHREDDEPDSVETFLEGAGIPEHLPDGQLVLYVGAYPISGPVERDDRPVHVLIPDNLTAGDIEIVFDQVLPDFGYRIREDAS